MICGDCTLCCTICKVPELDKPDGVMCKHAGNGCEIYEERPESCRVWTCAWLQSGANIELRPDKCGIVWERKGNVMYGIKSKDFSRFPHLEKQIEMFESQGAKVEVR